MKRPINVQPEVKACYLEIQMEGGREEAGGGRRRAGGKEEESFLPSFPLKLAISRRTIIGHYLTSVGEGPPVCVHVYLYIYIYI